MRCIPLFALIAIAAVVLPASAQVHRCKGANGQLTYSDQPCMTGQSGGIIERKKSREQILEQRLQAAEANEQRYRSQRNERERTAFEQQQRQERSIPNQPAPQNLAASPECKKARRELELVASIRTLSQDDKRTRTNTAIASVNAACGSNTELMQEPPKIFVKKPANITHCDPGACYDNEGGVYHKAGPDFMTGPNGRTCHRAGPMWNCN